MCKKCQHWKQTMPGYTRYDRFDRPDGEMPARGVCMYPIPAWVGFPGTTEDYGKDCLVFKEDKSWT